jgi:hypothetical protein
MQQDSDGLAAQQAAEAARREAGKLGMQVLKQQMQVSTATLGQPSLAAMHETATHWLVTQWCMATAWRPWSGG